MEIDTHTTNVNSTDYYAAKKLLGIDENDAEFDSVHHLLIPVDIYSSNNLNPERLQYIRVVSIYLSFVVVIKMTFSLWTGLHV